MTRPGEHRARVLVLALGLALAGAQPALARGPHKLPALVKQHSARVARAARKAGGQLELFRGRTHRLLVDGKARLLYQRVGGSAGHGTRRVRWWSAFRTFKLGEATDGQLAERFTRLVLDGASKRGRRSEPREPRAILPGGSEVAPDVNLTVYHGTCNVSPEVALRRGLPGRGSDWRLREHAEPSRRAGQKNNSAFRGATQVVADPVSGNGAAYWADIGGWVYKIAGVPGWDVNAQLAGRVARPLGYRGNLMSAEVEIAIPARVPARFIQAYGKVQPDAHGRPRVKEWVDNPGFTGQ